MSTLKSLSAAVAAMLLLASAAALAAEPYPSKPIKVIVPFPAGGTTDLVARVIGQELTKAWGQQVVVENRPGAGGNIGSEAAAKSPPDGYTLLMGTVGTHGINPSLYKKLPYDAVKDFAPITLATSGPNILVVHPSLPAKSVKELIAYAKANPAKLNFASSGNGTSIHLCGELFKTKTGLQMTHVPYKGSAPAVTDLIGGQVQLMFDNMPSAWPHVKTGKLRALAVTTAKRSQTAPDLPTIAESGVPGFDATSWFGLLAPAGTPKEIVTKLNKETVRILKTPEVKERLLAQGAEPVGNSPEQFAAHIKAEIEKWRKVVEASGAQID
ncbi:MAG TPA: tripartite tricarboxylate transporter substrate binding protein [Myxococcaceae bacterium]|nr:tripartite tricarboxylate transporter substrate binding protein [Myxococcaceae bacterium]